MTLKLYYHPVSTNSLAVQMFLAEAKVAYEPILVDILTGAQRKDAFLALNPRGLVPVLVDGDFVLTESSAILKYIADKVESPTYPRDPRRRARVNERMDWINTDVSRELGYHMVYPQLMPHHARSAGAAQDETIAWGKQKCEAHLAVLDSAGLGTSGFLCGDELSIADFLAAEQLHLASKIGSSFARYPNIQRWLETMRALPSWKTVHASIDGWGASLVGKSFVAVGI
jgi:glutathione S-transferase